MSTIIAKAAAVVGTEAAPGLITSATLSRSGPIY